MRISKVTLLIYNVNGSDDTLVQDLKTTLENDDYIDFDWIADETKDMDDWNNDHFLNDANITAEEALEFFDGLVNVKDAVKKEIDKKRRELAELQEEYDRL